MFRTFFAVVVTALLVAGGSATAAQAAPPPGLRLAAVSVTSHGPGTAPVSSFCMAIHPPWSDCGYVTVDATVTGFDAYGGIVGCAPWDEGCPVAGEDWYSQFGAVTTPTSMRLTQHYRCGTSGKTHRARTTVQIGPMWNDYRSAVNFASFVDSDTAKLSVGGSFPNPREYSVCPERTVVVSARLDSLVFSLDGTNGAPDRTWRRAGTHAVPLPS